MDKEQRSLRRTEMFSHIEAWRASGKSQKLYCVERNIPYSVFQYWRRKFRKERERSDSDDFAELVVGNGLSGIEIVYPSGVVLRLPPGTDPRVIHIYLSYGC